jgi:uncharacterized integral membrane protein (TIGR00697 family)
MFPEAVGEFFGAHQNLLWLATVGIDLSLTLLLYRLFGRQGLYAAIVLAALLCNIQGPKLTEVFGLTTSLGVIIYSGIYFATDLLGERYGKREANRAVWIGFAVNVIIVATMSISLLFQPATGDEKTTTLAGNAHHALSFLFGFTPRFVFGSMLAYLVSQTHDVWFFHFIKARTGGRHLWLRNTLSTVVSQAIDTTIYSLVVWWALLDFQTAVKLALVKYLFKFVIAVLDTPFIYWARRWDTGAQDWTEAPAGSRATPVAAT